MTTKKRLPDISVSRSAEGWVLYKRFSKAERAAVRNFLQQHQRTTFVIVYDRHTIGGKRYDMLHILPAAPAMDEEDDYVR